MRKAMELTDPKSCLNKAAEDELLFVLLERDDVAAETIHYWINRRLATGKNQIGDAQIEEAATLAKMIYAGERGDRAARVASLRERGGKSETPLLYAELRQCYDIVLKTARRLTRDLRHAIDNVPMDSEFRPMMLERLEYFKTILQPTSEYRAALVSQLEAAERDRDYWKQRYEATGMIGGAAGGGGAGGQPKQ